MRAAGDPREDEENGAAAMGERPRGVPVAPMASAGCSSDARLLEAALPCAASGPEAEPDPDAPDAMDEEEDAEAERLEATPRGERVSDRPRSCASTSGSAAAAPAAAAESSDAGAGWASAACRASAGGGGARRRGVAAADEEADELPLAGGEAGACACGCGLLGPAAVSSLAAASCDTEMDAGWVGSEATRTTPTAMGAAPAPADATTSALDATAAAPASPR